MEIATHFLYPSTLFASRTPHHIKTILGSCVAVCLWDSVLHFGGMNHYMLPFWNGQGLASPKYGNIAIEKLIEKMITLGSLQRNLRAKVFGGGEVINTTSSQFNIGQRNINIAFEMLEEAKIQVVSSSVGGKSGRKIIYITETSEVMHRFVGNSQST